MINVDVTRLSSKGQVVIPQDMRREFAVGEKFIIVKDGRQIILKPASRMGKNFLEDLDFAKRTMEALERYERGDFKELDGEKFLAELEKW